MYNTTQKSRYMLTQDDRRSPISIQIFALIQKHGLENIAQSILHLCHEQLSISRDRGVEESIRHLENLVDTACRIQDWK